VAADSPDTATAWCWRVPAGSITVFPTIETTLTGEPGELTLDPPRITSPQA